MPTTSFVCQEIPVPLLTIITVHAQTYYTPLPSNPAHQLTILHAGNDKHVVYLRDENKNDLPLALTRRDDLLALHCLIGHALTQPIIPAERTELPI